MGPFPTAIRQLKFLVVGIDYFTKWVEAEPLATITEKNICNFVWRNISVSTEYRGYSSPTMESNLTIVHSGTSTQS